MVRAGAASVTSTPSCCGCRIRPAWAPPGPRRARGFSRRVGRAKRRARWRSASSKLSISVSRGQADAQHGAAERGRPPQPSVGTERFRVEVATTPSRDTSRTLGAIEASRRANSGQERTAPDVTQGSSSMPVHSSTTPPTRGADSAAHGQAGRQSRRSPEPHRTSSAPRGCSGPGPERSIPSAGRRGSAHPDRCWRVRRCSPTAGA